MITYGRGVFQAHEEYVKYMAFIVRHPNYEGMPNATSDNGRINWQVSSGKTTSFYKDYLARRKWWVDKADYLNLPGEDNSMDRFTVAARIIHPTGDRPCRLCGEKRNVGYFYLSANGVRALRNLEAGEETIKGLPIEEAINLIPGSRLTEVRNIFPERAEYFDRYGLTSVAFANSNHLRSTLLSPGYMGNPPDRLDGFHDYCLFCRQRNDPGRSSENLRSYSHDRRAFEMWTDGNWALADALYNSAGKGKCDICEVPLEKVSPDHVGPLACGFSQNSLFTPLCTAHNSAKQRRMSYSDILKLINWEEATSENAMSWYSVDFWNEFKLSISTNAEAKELSDQLRSRQDVYLRALEIIKRDSQYEFLRSLLHPEFALRTYEFIDLDPGSFTFSGYTEHEKDNQQRQSLARRSIRIGLDSLGDYFSKPPERRMKRSTLNGDIQEFMYQELGEKISLLSFHGNQKWSAAIEAYQTGDLAKFDHELSRIIWAKIDTTIYEPLRQTIVVAINQFS